MKNSNTLFRITTSAVIDWQLLTIFTFVMRKHVLSFLVIFFLCILLGPVSFYLEGWGEAVQVTACQDYFVYFEALNHQAWGGGGGGGDPPDKHLTTHKQNLTCLT